MDHGDEPDRRRGPRRPASWANTPNATIETNSPLMDAAHPSCNLRSVGLSKAVRVADMDAPSYARARAASPGGAAATVFVAALTG